MKHANTSHIGITPKRKPRTDVIANMAAVAAEKSVKGHASRGGALYELAEG